jgi:hypothetical protein
MNPIHFLPNVPQLLSLKDTSGVIDGFNVLYETSDNRVLQLPRPAAVKLNLLDPAQGEEISVTKHQQEPKQPAEWVFALTPKSEQARAAKESQSELERQLAESLVQTRAVRQMPKSARTGAPEPAEQVRGTGTYGPVPEVALGSRKLKPEAVPFNVAFLEVTRFVVDGLKTVGEQWNDQAKQDAICSVLISASRQGLLSLWERP